MLEGHGNDWYNYNNKLKVDFSSNVWFEGPPVELLDHIKQQVDSVANYPEPHAKSLCQQTEQHYSLPKGSALITNGSVEAFYIIAKLFTNQSSTVICPPFAEYEDACLQFNHSLSFINNIDLNENDRFDSKLLWLCNPNNPDGKLVNIATIKKLLTNNPMRIFIIDEAYADLCFQFESAIPLLKRFDNLIIVKSFTKAFAIPGLRLGILLSNPKIIDQLRQHLMPWSVNSLAQAAGSFIFGNNDNLLFDKERMIKLSLDLQKALSNHPLLEVTPSPTNYFLCKTLKGTAAELKEYLIQQHGFLIRNASNFRGLSEQHFRIAIQSKEHNDKLIKAISLWLK